MSDGFHKWKNALRKFREHENSSMHKEAALKLAAKSSSVGLHAQLSSVILANQQFHRKMLLKVILGVQYFLGKAYLFMAIMKMYNHLREIYFICFYCSPGIAKK